MLEDTRPKQFDILIRLSGFSHGTDVWLGNAKDLIISGTAQVNEAIGCRDDIIFISALKGFQDTRAFKIMEAVRKGEACPMERRRRCRSGACPSGTLIPAKIRLSVSKAHAVAYVMMAFRIAWFKVHRPLAFYAASFSIGPRHSMKNLCAGASKWFGKKLGKSTRRRMQKPCGAAHSGGGGYASYLGCAMNSTCEDSTLPAWTSLNPMR